MFLSKKKNNTISLNDLPKFSNWPKKLFSFKTCDIKHKTGKEVLREYQNEKWGKLLKRVRSMKNPALHKVEQAYCDQLTPFPSYDRGVFYLTNEKKMLDRHLELYSKILKPHLKSASSLVELGAGFGSKILGLSQQKEFSKIPLVACEYSKAGRDIISTLSNALKKNVSVGHCDLRKLEIDADIIPEKSVLFTSYAAHYVPNISSRFVKFLSQLKPKVVFHFEPVYEYYPKDSLHGIMCRRYVELNDYGRNLASIIEDAKRLNKISVKIKKNILGSNPLLPISVIEWAVIKY